MELRRVDVEAGQLFRHIVEGGEWLVTEVRDDGMIVIYYEDKSTSKYEARTVNPLRFSIEYSRL